MKLELTIRHENSGDLFTLNKNIDDEYLDTYYTIEDFFGEKLEFKVKKTGWDEKKSEIISTGELAGIWGHLTEKKYWLKYINLEILKISPQYFLNNINKIEKQGFNVFFDKEYVEQHIKRFDHEKSRTKFQKFFGLNKYIEVIFYE